MCGNTTTHRGGMKMASYTIKVSTTIPLEMFDYCKKNGIPYAHVIANTWRFIYMENPETLSDRVRRLADRLQELANANVSLRNEIEILKKKVSE